MLARRLRQLHKPNGENGTFDGMYGPGSFVDKSFTPVPRECRRLLEDLAAKTPGFTKDRSLLDGVTFEGSDLPCIPGPIKSQAFTAVVHAMAGIIGHEIMSLRGIETNNKTVIYTDQAGMYPATPALSAVDGLDGFKILANEHLPQYDHHALGTPIRLRSQAIYPTFTEDVWYQIHGSTNPDPILRAIGVDPEIAIPSNDAAYDHIKRRTMKMSARDLEMIMMEHGLPGSIVHSPKSWLQTTMGQALARHPLVNYEKQEQTEKLKPVAFSSVPSGDKRPLSGLKVLELARIIAAPACGAVLSSMGAEVIRVQTDRLTDFTPAQLNLMAGKKTYKLDIADAKEKDLLLALISEADVILQGYRLRSLERHGLGLNVCLEMANRRGKGIIYLDENCYGPDGYFAERPGWQQVADAAAGSSYVIGKAYGFPDGQGVLPSLPISDMSTGILAAVTILSMVRDRARFGGSWHGTTALTAYNMATLTKEVGLYQPEIVEQIQEKFNFGDMDSESHVIELYYMIADSWKKAGKAGGNLIADEKYFCHFEDSVYGKDLRILAPVVRYEDEATTPRWTSPPVPFCHEKGYPKWQSK